jgi:hypothetical protein
LTKNRAPCNRKSGRKGDLKISQEDVARSGRERPERALESANKTWPDLVQKDLKTGPNDPK